MVGILSFSYLFLGEIAHISQAVHVLPVAAINRWGLAKHVPLEGDISYLELSEITGISQPLLKRILRYAMTSRLFCERDGRVAHTSTSRLLVENLGLASFVDLHTDLALKSIAHTTDALEKWPNSTSPREGGYSISLGKPGETSVYEEVTKDAVRTVNFGHAMQFFSSGEGYEVTSLVDGYPWANLGKGTVVDVGHHHVRESDHVDRQSRLVERMGSPALQSRKHSRILHS